MANTQFKLTTPLMRTVLYVASGLVLAVSITLYFLPGSTATYFSWTINPPLTAAFLGAGYMASFILEFLSAREKIWSNARTAVPAVWVFTFLTLLVTLIHLDRFHFNAPQFITVLGTWVWLLVYAGVPILMGLAWILQVRKAGGDPPRLSQLPTFLRLILLAQGVWMFLIGIVMLLSPQSLIPHWPWALSALTCRAIGAWGIGIGIIALQAAWENEWRRLKPMMLSYAIYGALQLLNLLRFFDELDWAQSAAWGYSFFILSIFLVGLFGVVQGRQPLSTDS